MDLSVNFFFFCSMHLEMAITPRKTKLQFSGKGSVSRRITLHFKKSSCLCIPIVVTASAGKPVVVPVGVLVSRCVKNYTERIPAISPPVK